MNEQPLELRQMLRAVARRWVFVLALLWAGSVGGYLVASHRKPVFVARSSVLLPASPVDKSGMQLRNIDTQVNIARNGNILDKAGHAVTPPLSAQKMRKRISVKGLTADILEVRAEAPTARDAVLLADAVAREYVAEATDTTSRVAAASLSGLEAQAVQDEARLQRTKAAIDAATATVNGLPANSPERARQAAVVDGLQVDEVEAARQVALVADKIADARLEDQLNRAGTRLYAPAIRPTEPSQPKAVVLTLGGALLGLLLGLLLALVVDRRDSRLRTRSAISDVVAAPVLASLEVPRRSSARVCQAMLDSWEPGPLQSWNLRQACTRLGVLRGDRLSEVVVVGLPGDVAAPLLAIQLAVFAASMGTPTALVISTTHPTAAGLRSACHHDPPTGEVRPYLTTSSGPVPPPGDDQRARAELTITLLIADDGREELLLSIPGDAIATLAVSSGFATPDALAATALACLDAGHPLVGVLLANPDPSDSTTGDPGPAPSPLREQGLLPLEPPVEASELLVRFPQT